MIFGTHSWVCSICGQGLTRKSTATRHNNNLHSGGAIIVRPFDYIIGRLKGDFFPDDPSLYRYRKKIQMIGSNSSYYHSNDNKNTTKTWSGGVQHESGYGNETQQRPIKVNTAKTMGDHQSVDPLQTNNTVGNKPTSIVENMPEMALKLNEIEILVKKHYPPQVAVAILSRATYLAYEGKSEDFLNQSLDYFRNIDRAKSS